MFPSDMYLGRWCDVRFSSCMKLPPGTALCVQWSWAGTWEDQWRGGPWTIVANPAHIGHVLQIRAYALHLTRGSIRCQDWVRRKAAHEQAFGSNKAISPLGCAAVED